MTNVPDFIKSELDLVRQTLTERYGDCGHEQNGSGRYSRIMGTNRPLATPKRIHF